MTSALLRPAGWPAPLLSPAAVQQAASMLAERRRNGLAAAVLPPACRPTTLTDAFAVQQAVAALAGQLSTGALSTATICGWKCGLSSVDEQGQLKIVAAPLYQAELSQGDNCFLWPSARQLARVEPEYAYPLLHDLPAAAHYSDAALQAALGRPRLALELIASRYAADSGAGYLDQLADGLFNQGLWLGPELQQPPAAAFVLQVRTPGQAQLIAARHPNGDPQAPLLPFIRLLHSCGIDLAAGQLLITGSFAGVLEMPMATPLTLQFAEEPALTLQFSAR
jgi:2-keto-4-pentenoate hydratase